MGITIDAPGSSQDETRPKLIADRALFADTALTTLLEAGDPDAGIQVASRPGKVIPPHIVAALDLVERDGRVVQASAPVEEAAPVAKESAPAENKQAAPAENKGGQKPEAKKRRIGRRKSDA